MGRRKVESMFEVVVAGTVIRTVKTKEEAEKLLSQAMNSPFAWVHPKDVFYIRKSVEV